jgi:hypothetical protein
MTHSEKNTVVFVNLCKKALIGMCKNPQHVYFTEWFHFVCTLDPLVWYDHKLHPLLSWQLLQEWQHMKSVFDSEQTLDKHKQLI